MKFKISIFMLFFSFIFFVASLYATEPILDNINEHEKFLDQLIVDDSNHHIFRYFFPENTVIEKISGTEFDWKSPVVSWNNEYILFETTRSSSRDDIWIMNIDGTNPRMLTSSGSSQDFNPRWSPLSSNVAFSSYRPYGSGSRVMATSLGGDDVRDIYYENGRDSYPAGFKNEDTVLFFTQLRYWRGDIKLMSVNVDGTNAQELCSLHDVLSSNTAIFYSVVNNNGTKIVFVLNDNHWNSEIYSMDVSSCNVQLLVNSDNNPYYPSWDGDKILFSYLNKFTSQREIWSIDEDGNNKIRLLYDDNRSFYRANAVRNNFILFMENWESGIIDNSVWNYWGSPQSKIYTPGYLSDYSVDPNGDGWCDSGLSTIKKFNMEPGLTVEWLAKAEGMGRHFQDIEVAVVIDQHSSGNCANEEWNKLFGMRVGGYYQILYTYISGTNENESKSFDFTSTDWNKFKIYINSDKTVSFYLNDILLHRSTEILDTSIYSNQNIIIGGRSAYNFPSLVDNLRVSKQLNVVMLDDFSNGLDNWVLFGSPQPVVRENVFGRSHVFDNMGDGMYNSGGVSRQTVGSMGGFSVESDIYVHVTNVAGCWNHASIGLTRHANPGWANDGDDNAYGILFDFGYAGDACWATPIQYRRHGHLGMGFVDENGTWRGYDDESRFFADAYLDKWTNFRFDVSADRTIRFYVDGNLLWSPEQKLHPDLMEGRNVTLGMRSSGSAGKAYHDFIRVMSGSGPTSHTVTPSAGNGGSIDPDDPQTINHGTTATFTVTPDVGYTASVGGTCGGTLTGTTYVTEPITADCTVAATFTLKTYTVTPSAGENGTIDPDTPKTVNHGERVTFTVTPDPDYTASVAGACGGTLTGTTYVTNPITADCTVIASFSPREGNRAPVVEVEAQQIFLKNMGEMATLDASPSSDPDGDALFFSWREDPRNPRHGLIPMSSDSLSRLHLYFPMPGRYVYTVRVSDGELMSEGTRSITVYVPGRTGLIGYTPSNALVRVPDAVIRVHNTAADARNNVNAVDLAISDSLGRYTLENVEPVDAQTGRTYHALVERPGFASTEVLSMAVRPDPGFADGVDNYDIGRGYIASLSGIVRRVDGTPIPGVLASIVPGLGGRIFAASTDLKGQFTITDVPKGSWIMQLRGEGFRPEVRDVNVADDMPELSIIMQAVAGTGNLTGKVFLAGTDRPVAGAAVALGTGAQAVANSQGVYAFTGIPVGDYTLTVTRDGFAPQRLPVARVRTGDNTLDLPISYSAQGPTVFGTVTDAVSGAPVRLATVGVEGTSGLLVRSDISDYTGFYQMRDVPTGPQTFRVSAPGYAVKTFTHAVTASMEQNVALDRRNGWTAPTRPARDLPEARVAQAFIFLNNLNESALLDARSSTGTNLRYLWRENPDNPVLGLLPADSTSMQTIQISGFSKPGIYIFELRTTSDGRTSANTATISVFAPGLSGNVHASPSDGIIGLNAATVRAYTTYEAAASWTDGYVESAQTRDNPVGDFAMRNLAPGAYWIVARAQTGTGYLHYGPVLRRVSHGSAARDTLINVPRQEFSLSGIIRDAATGLPLEGVRVVTAAGSLSETYRTTTDAAGWYRLSAVPRGSGLPVMLLREGYQTQVMTLSINGDLDRDVNMAAAPSAAMATLSGRVIADYQGLLLPVYNAEVVIASGLYRTFTDADGSYHIANLPPGHYYGTIRKPGYLPRGLADFGFAQLQPGQNTIDRLLPFAANGPVIRGSVINARQEPIPGVTIRILESTGRFAAWAKTPEADDIRAELAEERRRQGRSQTATASPQSDAAGIFQMIDMPHGQRRIEARLPDGRTAVKTVNVDGNLELVFSEDEFQSSQQWTLTYTAGTGGRIEGTTAQTVNHGGDGTPVRAVPNATHYFVQWSDTVHTATRQDRNVTRHISVIAQFAVIRDVTVTVTAGTTGGTVAGGGSFRTGDTVTPRAIPEKGHAFSHWTLNGRKVNGAGAVYTFTVHDNMNLVAHFKEVKGLPGVLMLLLDEE